MKKLITVADINKNLEDGITKLYIDKNTIITPAALDLARENRIVLSDDINSKENSILECSIEEKEEIEALNSIGMDADLIVEIVKKVLKETLLLNNLETFEKEYDISGLKLIRGNTVKCEIFNTEIPNVRRKDIASEKKLSNMRAGFMVIENSTFDWELEHDEFEYIIEGNLNVSINGNTYKGKAGDVFFIPKNSKITWNTVDYVKLFYVTCTRKEVGSYESI